jgi:chromosomal replication initiator protein
VVKDDSDRLSVLRQELRQRLGDERFELWLGEPTELVLDERSLKVLCGSTAEANWLRRNLNAALAGCVADVFSVPTPIVFQATDRPQDVAEVGRKPKRKCRTAAPPPVIVRADRQRQLFLGESDQGNTLPGVEPAASPRPHFAKHSFWDLIVGSCNRLAAGAAREIAEQPGRFSPLFLHGPPGTGKSHLLSAIAQLSRGARHRPRVTMLSAEQFTSQFLEALDRRGIPGFRQKTRSVDLLLVDDVQFVVGKKATYEELLYTVDALQSRGGQVVLTSDRPVAELPLACSGLASRVSSGLAVGLELPEFQVRQGIVRVMAERMQVQLGEEVAQLIAQQVVGSARLLAGAINRLVASSMAAGKPIDAGLAEMALNEFCRQHAPQVRLADIQRAVCDEFGVEASSLKSDRKTRGIAEPRMLAMWLARRYTRAALSEIGDFFGRRSHSTVVSAQKKLDALIGRRGQLVMGDQLCGVEEAIRRIEARLRTA